MKLSQTIMELDTLTKCSTLGFGILDCFGGVPFTDSEAHEICEVTRTPGIHRWGPMGADFMMAMSWDHDHMSSDDYVHDFLTVLELDPEEVLQNQCHYAGDYNLLDVAKLFKRYCLACDHS